MEIKIAMTMPPKGEVFTHKDDDGTIRTFPVCMMNEFVDKHTAGCKLIKKMETAINADIVNHIRNNMGIEQDRLDRLVSPYLDRPILGIVWPSGYAANHFTVIDGNHRVVKLFESGKTKVEAWLFHPNLWRQFVLNVPDEIKKKALANPSSGILDMEKELLHGG